MGKGKTDLDPRQRLGTETTDIDTKTADFILKQRVAEKHHTTNLDLRRKLVGETTDFVLNEPLPETIKLISFLDSDRETVKIVLKSERRQLTTF